MAEDIRHFVATIPAGTPSSSPAVIACAMPVRTVSRIDWRVPAGPAGLMSWYVAMGGVQVFPVPPSPPVTADSETGTWVVDQAPDSGAWQVIGYNTGTYPHSVYLTFWCDRVTPRPAYPAPLAAWELGPSPDLSHAGPPVGRRT